MPSRYAETATCGVCGKQFRREAMISVDLVRPALAGYLDTHHPDWRKTGQVCLDDLQTSRRDALEQLLRDERGELNALERSVIESIESRHSIVENIESNYEEKVGFGDRLADRMAGFAGSWTFILGFTGMLAIWMAINVWLLRQEPFDPYPFILLNLLLSCVAALQAPLIMMSQRRVEAKDRMRSENDYQVNLKAEIEIRHLHEKIDHHLLKQWDRLAEIEQMQLELLDALQKPRK